MRASASLLLQPRVQSLVASLFCCTSTLAAAARGGAHGSCNVSRPAEEVCADFCDDRCSFYNESLGESGLPQKLTVYRLTPTNVTGLQNKDSGDAAGDVSFFLSKKNLTQQCAKDPEGWGCFLDKDDMYGRFELEVDGRYGPYAACNPVGMVDDHAARKGWADTRNFQCGQGCFLPDARTGCSAQPPLSRRRNGTTDDGGYECWCDGTRRHEHVVGREAPPFAAWYVGPDYWVPQCKLDYYEYYDRETKRYGGCLTGALLRTVRAWDFASVSTSACEACSNDDACSGWRTTDNVTAQLLTGPLARSLDKCIGGEKWVRGGGGGSGWGAAGNVGGVWLSTPIEAECAAGETLGAPGCAWRVLSASYHNASCIDQLVDAAVEAHGASCFHQCGTPLDRIGDCYLECYRNVLLGDASRNLTAIKRHTIVRPWEDGFTSGACPLVSPKPCHGSQCGTEPAVPPSAML